MNRILDKIFLIPGKIMGMIFPYKLLVLFRPFKRRLYTGWIGVNFSHIGHNTLICGDLHITGGGYISIGDNSCIDKHCSITTLESGKGMKISIGNHVSIGPYAHITAINKIEIGDNVDIGPRCLMTDNSKKPTIETMRMIPRKRPLSSKGPIVIGSYTWIGENVCIMPGVTIGECCVIGANAVVAKSFPDGSIIAGNPAKLISKIQ